MNNVDKNVLRVYIAVGLGIAAIVLGSLLVDHFQMNEILYLTGITAGGLYWVGSKIK